LRFISQSLFCIGVKPIPSSIPSLLILPLLAISLLAVKGGIGKISGVIAGVLIIGSLTNGMILMDVNSYTQKVIKGLVLAIAVGIDCLSNRNKLA